VAIIGCGGITSAHLNGIRILQEAGLDDVRVTALCSRDPENAARYNNRADAPPPLPPIVPWRNDPLNIRDIYVSDLDPHEPAKICTDWRTAVIDPDVDAVIVLASVAVHHAIGSAALAAGKHVLIEKPFAITVRAARKMCEIAAERNLSLGVAESLRYRLQTRAERWALDEGLIGNLEMIAHVGIGSVWSPDKIVGKTAWRHRKFETGSGILMDIGSHLFDKIRYLCGELDRVNGTVRIVEPLRTTRNEKGEIVEQVTCDVEDTAFATVSFKNGAVGTFNVSWAGHGEPVALPGGTVLYGDLGCIKEGNIISDRAGVTSVEESFEHMAPSKQRGTWFPKGVDDAFALELHEFFEAIRGSRQPETDGVEGLRDIAACYAIVESSTRGESVSFDDVENCRIETYQRPINDSFGLR
jgi:predicted dehydrogenase